MIIRKMGFSDKILRLIMRSISNVSFSFVLNGRVYGNICPTRGLRQGDPISYLLFVICAQGLSSMLHGMERADLFQGIRFRGQGPRVSHLFFAVDSLLFFKAEKEVLWLSNKGSRNMLEHQVS